MDMRKRLTNNQSNCSLAITNVVVNTIIKDQQHSCNLDTNPVESYR